MKKSKKVIVFILISICCLTSSFSQEDNEPIAFGFYRVIHSKVMDEDRKLLMYLPSDYENSEKEYPVLYRLDGSKEFYYQSVTSTWYLASELANIIPKHIVVCMQSDNRFRDISYEKDKFESFIKHELIPFIDTTYRTNGSKILCGQSASSIFTFDLFLNEPKFFDAYFLMSFGWSTRSLESCLSKINKNENIKELDKISFFFTNSTNDPFDSKGGEMKNNGEKIINSLKNNISNKDNIEYQIYDVGHVPYPGLYDGLKWYYTKNDN